MKINIQDINSLSEKGIYMIRNLINNKVYIGSTDKSFIVRWKKHLRMLKGNYHYNNHLQLSYNKYTLDNFEFSVLEILNTNLLEKEKFYIDKYLSYDKNFGYNKTINPELSPSLQLSVQEKISNTLKRGYKEGRIKKSESVFKKGNIPWNTGKNFKNKNSSVTKRKKLKPVEVFDINMKFIGKWDSSPDLSDFTKSKNNIFNDIFYPLGINRSCISGKTYKNYYFRHAPLISNN